MKKLKLRKKTIVVILAVIASILLIRLLYIFSNIEQPKTYDIEKLSSLLIKEYSDLNLTEMDYFDIISEFGFDQQETPSSMFLKSLVLDGEGNDITKDKNFIVIINSENYDYFEGILASYVDSNVMYTEDEEVFKLFDKAILKSDENYVYMIVSKKAKEIEKTINE